MARAILVSGGNDPRPNGHDYRKDISVFERYLREEAALTEIRVAHLDLGPCALRRFFQDNVQERNEEDEPLLLVYCGHGNVGRWGIDYPTLDFFSYDWLALWLYHWHGPITIVNNCCYAESIVDALREARVGPERCSVLAASGAQETTGVMITQRLLAHWRRRIAYEPQRYITHAIVFDTDLEGEPLAVERESRWTEWHWRWPFWTRVHLIDCGEIGSLTPHTHEVELKQPIPLRHVDRWGAQFDHFFFPAETPPQPDVT